MSATSSGSLPYCAKSSLISAVMESLRDSLIPLPFLNPSQIRDIFSADSFSDDSHPCVLFFGMRSPYCVHQVLFDWMAERGALCASFCLFSLVETVLHQGKHTTHSNQRKEGERRYNRWLCWRRSGDRYRDGKHRLCLCKKDPLLYSLRLFPSGSRCESAFICSLSPQVYILCFPFRCVSWL